MELLSKCRKLVGHFNHSPSARAALRSKQELLNIPQKSLKQDVDTHLNSTYDMLASLIDNDEAIADVLRPDPKYASLLLSPDEVETLKSIYRVLEPWKKLTVLMSTESYPTISMVAPSIHKLLTVALRNEGDTDLVLRMKKEMSDDLKARYKDPNIRMLLNIAAFLDPIFRQLDFISDAGEKKKVKLEVKRRITSMKTKLAAVELDPENPELPQDPQPSGSESVQDSVPLKKPKVEKGDFFKTFFLTLSSQMSHQPKVLWKWQNRN